jgi:hypothetical protein
MDKLNLVKRLSCNYTKIISRDECAKHNELNWGGNGLGDRWCGGKMFCYSSIYAKSYKLYDDKQNIAVIDEEEIKTFQQQFISSHKKLSGIIGIYPHYELSQEDINNKKRPIRDDISEKIKKSPCVNCGSKSDLVCDHKNDLYNNPRVLCRDTQTEDDFQSLCNHCNLLKRQVCKVEKETKKIYSAKDITRYKKLDYLFPWEMKHFDINDPDLKVGTYWYDPSEFDEKTRLYELFTLPIVTEIKRKVQNGTITKVE